MSKEKGEGLFRALHSLLDAISVLNLQDLEAVAERRESSTAAVAESVKGKAKVANPDWEDVPFHPVPIILLSRGPKFSQVVGSSSETPIVSPSPIAVASSLLAGRPVIGTAAAARMTMNPPGGGHGDGGPSGGGPPGGGPPGGGGGGGAPPPPLPQGRGQCRTKRRPSSLLCGTIPPQKWDNRTWSKSQSPVARRKSSLPQW
jgi:hypothetical protein